MYTPDFEDESLDFDNQESNEDEDALESDDDSGDSLESDDESEDSPKQKGNLSVALRQERENAKNWKKRAEENDAMLRQSNSIINQLRDRDQFQQPQVDPEQYKERRRNELWENPDSFLQGRDQYLMQQVQKNYAPLIAQNARNHIAAHPEYASLYQRPAIQRAINAYIEQEVGQSGNIDLGALENAANYFVEIAKDLSGNGEQAPVFSQKGKEKLTSTVNKQGNQQPKLSEKDTWDKAMNSLSPRDYMKWEQDPKNRALMNRVLSTSR